MLEGMLKKHCDQNSYSLNNKLVVEQQSIDSCNQNFSIRSNFKFDNNKPSSFSETNMDQNLLK